MEQLTRLPEKVLPLNAQLSATQSRRSTIIESLQSRSPYVVKNGVEALDLIPSHPVKPESIALAKSILEQNYGMTYPKEKFALLFDLIEESGWSEARFQAVFKWFRKNKYNQSWTESDWFQYGVKLFPFQWVRNHCAENNIREVDFIKGLDCYIVEGVRLYKQKDGYDLPIEKAK